MLPGEYTFNTADKEVMEIYSGDLEVQLPGSDRWKKIKAGEQFTVPAQSRFNLSPVGWAACLPMLIPQYSLL